MIPLNKSSDELVIECCPICASENLVRMDGTTSCLECGHSNIKPCSECMFLNDECDWRKEDNSCYQFPPEKPLSSIIESCDYMIGIDRAKPDSKECIVIINNNTGQITRIEG